MKVRSISSVFMNSQITIIPNHKLESMPFQVRGKFLTTKKNTRQKKQISLDNCMTVLDIEETKRKVKYVTSEIQKADWEGVENGLYDIIVHIHKEHHELAINTPRNHDIAALIQEMRYGFQAMDKRFDDLIHQMDKRFEVMDKRFDDLIHQMDKRFEAMDKRFDDMLQHTDKRFNLVFWIMGLGFTFFSFIITYGTFFK